jgi:hypothetical protein
LEGENFGFRADTPMLFRALIPLRNKRARNGLLPGILLSSWSTSFTRVGAATVPAIDQ